MKLLSWGANSYGQLGHGITSEQCLTPKPILEEEPRLKIDNIVSVSGGGGHTLILDKKGKVFSCGWNSRGQIGAPLTTKALHFVHSDCLADYNITNVYCGWESSFAITSSKSLLVWGANAFGQLGINRRETFFTPSPHECPMPPVKSVITGLRHTAMITGNDYLMVCGNGRKGQLGLIEDDGIVLSEATEPKLVPQISRVRSVGCGQYHTMVMTDDGHLYVWGDNRYGQLGIDPTLHPSVYQPLEIQPFLKEQLPSDSSIVCGWTHTLIITGNGDIYNWGRNSYGQLGCSIQRRPVSWQPQKMSDIERVKQVAVGSEHSCALLDSGDVVSWGWNEHGNCGTGNESNITTPTRIAIDKQLKSVLVATGGGHGFALVED